jgi:cytochrome c peroxidase
MKAKVLPLVLVAILGGGIALAHLSRGSIFSLPAIAQRPSRAAFDRVIDKNAERMVQKGRQIFRFDTFGDEAFWGDTLQLHQAIEGAKLGGVGPGVSPKDALAVGLKVDLDALPEDLIDRIQEGKVDLTDPATTLALLKLNAVVGLTGFFNPNGSLKSVGIQCAFCHSTVDNAFAPGIGHRLDGWPNRDLNVGAIVALAPDLSVVQTLLGVDRATLEKVLVSWGPGKFDAEVFMDGKAFRPDGKSAATLIPPAFGLAGVNLHTWTGWGSVTHWNAFVANLEMHGKGTFFDPRLNNAKQFPIAAANGFGNTRNVPDLITSKLAALHFFQLSIPAPAPPEGSFNQAQAAAGKILFEGKARCASCHVPPLFTEPGWNMHTPGEIGIDDFQANRAPDKHYRTSPLNGLFTHMKGGFFHDGRFATLADVVDHYNTFFNLGLTPSEKADLVEYLKSL